MKKFYITAVIVAAVSALLYYKLTLDRPPEREFPAPVTPEEKAFVRDAHRLGTRLYAVSKRAEEQTASVEEQQVRLKPVYEQIEAFIFQRLNEHSNRLSSIVVYYSDPDIQCTIYVKQTTEAEMKKIKKSADGCVGRIVENLPIVRYLMIKNE
jgi:hypothetical protein